MKFEEAEDGRGYSAFGRGSYRRNMDPDVLQRRGLKYSEGSPLRHPEMLERRFEIPRPAPMWANLFTAAVSRSKDRPNDDVMEINKLLRGYSPKKLVSEHNLDLIERVIVDNVDRLWDVSPETIDASLAAMDRFRAAPTSRPNPAKTVHHIGVRPLSAWRIVGTIPLGDDGIKARIGLPKRGKSGTRVITLLFEPGRWTIADAKRWALAFCKREGCQIQDVEQASVSKNQPLHQRRRRNSDAELRALERQVGEQFMSGFVDPVVMQSYMAAYARTGEPGLPPLMAELGQRALRSRRTWLAMPGDDEAQGQLMRLRETAGLRLLVDVDEMLGGYLDALLWSTNDESDEAGGVPMDRDHTIADFTPEAVAKARSDIELFVLLADADMASTEANGSQHGHDFWLTRNHHGAGFWDRGYGEVGTRLTALAHLFGEVNAYVGDDGTISF